MSVDFGMEGATYHTYARFCCQSQVQITYIACVRCILGAVQSHMIISQKGMRIYVCIPLKPSIIYTAYKRVLTFAGSQSPTLTKVNFVVNAVVMLL